MDFTDSCADAVALGASETAIETRIGQGGWTSSYAFLFKDRLDSREADLSVSSSLHRDRVMEARFDG